MRKHICGFKPTVIFEYLSRSVGNGINVLVIPGLPRGLVRCWKFLKIDRAVARIALVVHGENGH